MEASGRLLFLPRRSIRESRGVSVTLRRIRTGRHEVSFDRNIDEGMEYWVENAEGLGAEGPQRGGLLSCRSAPGRGLLLAYFDDIGRPFWLRMFPGHATQAAWTSWVWAAGGGSGTGRWFHSVEIVVGETVCVFGADAESAYAEAFTLTDGAPLLRFDTGYWRHWPEIRGVLQQESTLE